jgi:oxygen-dependent protoporphyrinogen oxidase
MGSLVDRLEGALGDRGVLIRTNAAVELLDRGRPGEAPWVLHTTAGPVMADGVVLAIPASETATLLAPHDTDAATLLRGIEYASVSLITLSYPEAAVSAPLEGTGFLVPQGTPAVGAPRTSAGDVADGPDELGHPPGVTTGRGDDRALVTACTYLDRKWPHLRRPGSVLIRASVGRFGDRRHESMNDAELVARAVHELEVMVGTTGAPQAWRVTRFVAAFPQYRVHHLLRVAGIESALQRLPGLVVAGAAYRGVGIPACVGSGRAAAQAVLASIASQTNEPGPAR